MPTRSIYGLISNAYLGAETRADLVSMEAAWMAGRRSRRKEGGREEGRKRGEDSVVKSHWTGQPTRAFASRIRGAEVSETWEWPKSVSPLGTSLLLLPIQQI